MLSGYIGAAEIGAAILETVGKVKRANPQARYCCDPVIGDVGRGVFVRPGVPEFMRERALPAADLVTPNQFELDMLAGRRTASLADALAAVDVLRARGPRADPRHLAPHRRRPRPTPSTCSHAIDQGRYRLRTPKLPISVNGAGDAIAALFFFHHLRTGSAAEALARATSVHLRRCCRRRRTAGAREMLLVEAQEEIVSPSRMFRAEPV